MLATGNSSFEVRRQMSPAGIPFDSQAFDLVTAVCVYHHVQPTDRLDLTAEIRRVLKPGGLFVMIEHNPFNPITQAVVNNVPIDKDAKLLSARRARSLASAAGLQPVGVEYFLYFPKFLYSPMRHLESLLRRFPLGGQYACYALNR
jgi:SAM-dependent methyltransferase